MYRASCPRHSSKLKSDDRYIASLDDGTQIHAAQVLLGMGLTFFKHVPPDLVEKLPAGSYIHLRHRRL